MQNRRRGYEHDEGARRGRKHRRALAIVCVLAAVAVAMLLVTAGFGERLVRGFVVECVHRHNSEDSQQRERHRADSPRRTTQPYLHRDRLRPATVAVRVGAPFGCGPIPPIGDAATDR